MPYLRASIMLLALIGGGCKKAGPASAPPAESQPITSKSGVEMRVLPAGSFRMGSKSSDDASPVHEVFVSALVIDRFEVTQAEYARLEISNPSHFKDPQRPVEMVRWSDAVEVCNERSHAEGLTPCYDLVDFACNFEADGYRLPTEAEWEYAARAGTITDYVSGSSDKKLGSYACFAGNSTKKTDLVGRKKPNAWGLHDMAGNVSEWVHDLYAADYYASSPDRDPRGAESGKKRVMRGGAWNSPAEACTMSRRSAEIPGTSDACFAKDTFGFRCVRRPSAAELDMLAK